MGVVEKSMPDSAGFPVFGTGTPFLSKLTGQVFEETGQD